MSNVPWLNVHVHIRRRTEAILVPLVDFGPPKSSPAAITKKSPNTNALLPTLAKRLLYADAPEVSAPATLPFPTATSSLLDPYRGY
jgi:hypothetical protein